MDRGGVLLTSLKARNSFKQKVRETVTRCQYDTLMRDNIKLMQA